MTQFYVTSIYAAVLALMMIALSVHVSMLRAKTNTSILDGGHLGLALRIRRHGNFVENVPITLLLMLLAELDGVSGVWIHAAGLLLVVGRILHAAGLRTDAATLPRMIGGLASFASIVIMAGNIIYLFAAK